MLLAESLLGSSSAETAFIEDVFSTYLYTGNSTSLGTQTITNGIGLSTKGGMVWIKGRSAAANHYVADTVRGAGISGQSNNGLFTNTQDAENGVLGADYDFISSFGSTGFTVRQYGGTTAERCTNYNGVTYSSWAFRKQAKFFDIVTYTGTGSARTISHSLGSVPGAIFIKARNEVGDWTVYHRSVGNASYLSLNNTSASAATTAFNSATPTSTVFSIGANNTVNRSGTTYVAYLFAHDAGGFGATGADNVISCGSFTTDGSGNATVNLGYEPQWIMYKRAVGGIGNWTILDTMRGWPVGGNDAQLQANTSGAETSAANVSDPNATGFSVSGISVSSTFIYIAIRRGPMRTPTSGTSVFALATTDANSTSLAGSSSSFVNSRPDLSVLAYRNGSSSNFQFSDLLRGYEQTTGPSPDALTTPTLKTSGTAAEATSGNAIYVQPANGSNPPEVRFSTNASGGKIGYIFRRAPAFFDVVCYTGTGVARTVSHNLGVVPELMIVKPRDQALGWNVWNASIFAVNANNILFLNETGAAQPVATIWNSTAPTAANFTVGTNARTNSSTRLYVAYLFASCPGVSKVGSYTGTGATQTINCGFSSGARFVLIKRTDSTGDWYVWDSARGIVAGNDPYLLLNSTAAEVTNTDWVDTAASGFELSNAAGNLVNTNGASYIFLAIA